MKPFLITLTIASICVALAGCKQEEPDKEKIYDIKAKVVAVDVAKKSVKLDHEDIPGFMSAMEMSFEVENAKLLDGLKAGDQVQGKLRRKFGTNLITELHKEPRTK